MTEINSLITTCQALKFVPKGKIHMYKMKNHIDNSCAITCFRK